MDRPNDSVISEFVLLGFSGSWETALFLMLIFSLLYIGKEKSQSVVQRQTSSFLASVSCGFHFPECEII